MNTIAVIKGILTLGLVIFICYMIIKAKKGVKRYKNTNNKKMTKTVSKSSKGKSTSKRANISRKSKSSNRNSRYVKKNTSSSHR